MVGKLERRADSNSTDEEELQLGIAGGQIELDLMTISNETPAPAAIQAVSAFAGGNIHRAAFYARAALNESSSSTTGQNAIESRMQAVLIRDIFGNLFRPVSLIPTWLTSTVLALAQQMYESRDFSAMPIIGDALEEAGCDNEEILNHCRQPGKHVRGCWVVDLLLDKK
jgi:hypothetical protein